MLERIQGDPLFRAWVTLAGLSLATTAAALMRDAGSGGAVLGLVILALAFMKMRVILRHYLGLAAAPSWRRGFDFSIGMFMLLAAAIYLIPAL